MLGGKDGTIHFSKKNVSKETRIHSQIVSTVIIICTKYLKGVGLKILFHIWLFFLPRS